MWWNVVKPDISMNHLKSRIEGLLHFHLSFSVDLFFAW